MTPNLRVYKFHIIFCTEWTTNPTHKVVESDYCRKQSKQAYNTRILVFLPHNKKGLKANNNIKLINLISK